MAVKTLLPAGFPPGSGGAGLEARTLMAKQEDEAPDDDGDVERSSRKPNPIDAHVGTRVRLRRMLLGMSQEKLGEHLGLTFQQVQKYEKGVNRIGASRLFDLSRVLGVPVQFFYDEAPSEFAEANVGPGFAERPAESFVIEFLSSREGLELNKAFVKITDARVRRSVVDLVRSIAGGDDGE
jgi:transcriptional regulator with XRE-family HTH domain